MMDERDVLAPKWIEWVIGGMSVAITVTAFMFMNFETKSDAKEKKDDFAERLVRIEQKLDQLLVDKERN